MSGTTNSSSRTKTRRRNVRAAFATALAAVFCLAAHSFLLPEQHQGLRRPHWPGIATWGGGGECLAAGDAHLPDSLQHAGAAAVQRGHNLTTLTEARDMFASFVGTHRAELEALWQGRLEGCRERGIVVAAGSPDTLANAFVALHVLRHSLGCLLPTTIM